MSTNTTEAAVEILGIEAAGTRVVHLEDKRSLILARGGAIAALRRELRDRLMKFARGREGRRCGICLRGDAALTLCACESPGHPLVARCQAHLDATPVGTLFLGLVTRDKSRLGAAAGAVRDAVAQEGANMRERRSQGAARARHPAIAQAVELATERDRHWFERNPARSHRLRLAAMEEVAEASGSFVIPAFAVVAQIEPGARLRCMRPHPEPQQVLALYDRLSNADQEIVARGFALEFRAKLDPNLQHRAQIEVERAWNLLDEVNQ